MELFYRNANPEQLHSGQRSKSVSEWCLGTWFSAGSNRVWLMFTLDNLRGLFFLREAGRAPVLPCPSYSSSVCSHIYSLVPPACFSGCLMLCTDTQSVLFLQGLPHYFQPKSKFITILSISSLRPSPAVWQNIGQKCENRSCL